MMGKRTVLQESLLYSFTLDRSAARGGRTGVHRVAHPVQRLQGGDGSAVLRVDRSGHSVPSEAPVEAAGWERSGRRNRDMEKAQALRAFFRVHGLRSGRSSE